MKNKITFGLLLFSIHAISQKVTLDFNVMQSIKKNMVYRVYFMKNNIVIDTNLKKVEVYDSPRIAPYIYKIEEKCSFYNDKISCQIRDKDNILSFLIYYKNRLEILDIAGNGSIYDKISSEDLK